MAYDRQYQTVAVLGHNAPGVPTGGRREDQWYEQWYFSPNSDWCLVQTMSDGVR